MAVEVSQVPSCPTYLDGSCVYRSPAGAATVDEPAGRWPALVDDATWRRAEELIASHARIPRQASGRYLLTGLLYCQRCGSRMTGATSKRIPARYRSSAPLTGERQLNPRCSEAVCRAQAGLGGTGAGRRDYREHRGKQSRFQDGFDGHGGTDTGADNHRAVNCEIGAHIF